MLDLGGKGWGVRFMGRGGGRIGMRILDRGYMRRGMGWGGGGGEGGMMGGRRLSGGNAGSGEERTLKGPTLVSSAAHPVVIGWECGLTNPSLGIICVTFTVRSTYKFCHTIVRSRTDEILFI